MQTYVIRTKQNKRVIRRLRFRSFYNKGNIGKLERNKYSIIHVIIIAAFTLLPF